MKKILQMISSKKILKNLRNYGCILGKVSEDTEKIWEHFGKIWENFEKIWEDSGRILKHFRKIWKFFFKLRKLNLRDLNDG